MELLCQTPVITDMPIMKRVQVRRSWGGGSSCWPNVYKLSREPATCCVQMDNGVPVRRQKRASPNPHLSAHRHACPTRWLSLHLAPFVTTSHPCSPTCTRSGVLPPGRTRLPLFTMPFLHLNILVARPNSNRQEILYAATSEDGSRIMREAQVEFAGREYTEEELAAE